MFKAIRDYFSKLKESQKERNNAYRRIKRYEKIQQVEVPQDILQKLIEVNPEIVKVERPVYWIDGSVWFTQRVYGGSAALEEKLKEKIWMQSNLDEKEEA